MAKRRVTESLTGPVSDEDLSPFAIPYGPSARRATGRKTMAARKGDKPRQLAPKPTARDYAATIGSMAAKAVSPRTGFEIGERMAPATPAIATAAKDYLTQTPLAQMGSDVLGGLRSAGEYALGDPANAIADLSVVGAGRDFLKDVERAASLRARGDEGGAYGIEQLAPLMLAAGIVPGGGAAMREGKRAALRAAEEGASDLAVAAQRRALTEAPPVTNRLYTDEIIARDYRPGETLPKYGYRNVSKADELNDIISSGYMLPPEGRTSKFFTMSDREVPSAGNRGAKPVLRVRSENIPEGRAVSARDVELWDEASESWVPILRQPQMRSAGVPARAAEEGASGLAAREVRRTFSPDEIERAAAAARAAYRGEASSFGVPLLRPGVEPISSQAARHGLPLDTPEMFYAQHGQTGYHGIVPPTRAEEVSFTTRPTVDIPAREVRTPEDLEGKWVVGLPGDKKVAGVELVDVNGRPLSEAVPLHGGPIYPAEQDARGLDLAWNNQEEASGPMRGALQRVLEAGGDPYGMVVSMGPHAHDQTMGMAKVLSNLMPSAEVTEKDLAVFNDMIRSGYGAGKKPIAGIPDFPGVESPEFVDFVKGLSMPVRANIVKALDSAAAHKAGFPEIGAVRTSMIQPELLHAPSGSAGFSVVKFGPESLEKVTDAPSFSVSSYNSPTRRAAGSKPMMMDMLYPLELTHPDFFAKRRAKGAAPASDFRSFTLQPVVQEYTPEVVDALMNYREQVKRRRGR